jgi:hypothetical protein
MLVVYNSESRRSEYLTLLAPLIEGRAVFLDYSQRRNWPWLSISTQLFHHFGPKPIPERFIIHHLPAVIVVRRFEWPKKFTFGERSHREENLAALQRNLVGGRSATCDLHSMPGKNYPPNTLLNIFPTFLNCRSMENACSICFAGTRDVISASFITSSRKFKSSFHARMACFCTSR